MRENLSYFVYFVENEMISLCVNLIDFYFWERPPACVKKIIEKKRESREKFRHDKGGLDFGL